MQKISINYHVPFSFLIYPAAVKLHDDQFKIYPDVNENHSEVKAKNGFYVLQLCTLSPDYDGVQVH